MHSGIALPLSILKANGWNPKSEGLEDDGPFQFMGDVQIVVMFVFFLGHVVFGEGQSIVRPCEYLTLGFSVIELFLQHLGQPNSTIMGV